MNIKMTRCVAALGCIWLVMIGPVPAALAASDGFEIENELVRIRFDPKSGTYDAVDKRDKREVLSATALRMNDWRSSDPGLAHRGSVAKVKDVFGEGKELTVESSGAGRPTLILKLRLYHRRGFIVAGAGVRNTTKNDIRLKTFSPIAGKLFPKVEKMDNLSFLEGNSGGANTLVRHAVPVKCNNNVLMTFGSEGKTRSLVLGGLTYADFQKRANIASPHEGLIEAFDPVGKRVAAGATYISEDLCYIDFTTDNPFEALEAYGRAVRDAMNVKINYYTFPSICMWFISVSHFGGETASVNDTPGAVREMDRIAKSGFLRYSPVAVRLVPDNYEANNEQGWWDEAHWQKYGRKERCIVEGGHYKAPYETSAKWCKAITDRGGIPTTYFQPGVRSEDYAEAFPGHMLFNEPHRYILNKEGKRQRESHGIRGRKYNIMYQESYDYTDPDFLRHMRDVYSKLGKAGMKGIFFDYPTRAFPARGGMEDRDSTAAAAYRTVYRLARDGLGPVCYLQERLAWGSDLATGLVDSQRTEGDNNILRAGAVRKAGLRWYKNRMLVNYDMDGKALIVTGQKQDKPINTEQRRAVLTMSYVVTGRFLATESFGRMSPEVLHDLSRTIPYHPSTLSARPIDAFVSEFPAVYDFAISDAWHQLVLYNSDEKAARTVKVKLAGDTAFGAMGLDAARSYYVYDFWNDRFVGKISGAKMLTQTLRPGEARVLAVHAVADHPQWIATDRHVMQGYTDLTSKPKWNAKARTLSGTSKLVAGEPYRVILAGNGFAPASVKGTKIDSLTDDLTTSLSPVPGQAGLAELKLTLKRGGLTNWSVTYK